MRKANQPEKASDWIARTHPFTCRCFQPTSHFESITVHLWLSASTVQQISQPLTGGRENRRAMGKKNSLRFANQKFSQRTAHVFLIQAIFRRQKCKAVRFKIN